MKLWLALCFLAAPAAAQDDAAAREAALFGEPEPAAASRDDSIFGGQTPQAAPLAPQADGLLDRLAIGGRLLSRTEVYLFDDTDADEQPLSTPQQLDVYFDARPSDRVRAFAKLRFEHDPTRPALGDGATVPRFLQAWVKADWDRRVFFTVGQQMLRWGVSRIWNPTDFARSARRDPLPTLDLRGGVSAIRARTPIEAINGAFVAVALLNRAETIGQVGGAARLEASGGMWAGSLSATARKDESLRLGGDWSGDIAGLFDLRLEAAVAHGNANGYRVAADETVERFDRDDDWIPSTVVGVEWTDADTEHAVGAEYFFNDEGHSDKAAYATQLEDGMDSLYLGRHYAAAYWVWSGPGSWNDTRFALTALSNLGDKTGIARLNVSHQALTWLHIDPFISGHFGPRGGELRRETEIDDIFSAAPIVIPAPIAQAGLWLRVTL